MPRKFAELSPQQSKGLQPDTGGLMDSAFLEMNNMRIYKGQWRKRPGQIQLISTLPITAAAGRCHAIVEYEGVLDAETTTIRETQNPTGDGTHEGWTLSTGSDSFALIDDFATNDASDYIHWAPGTDSTSPAGGGSRISTFTFADLSTVYTEIKYINLEYYVKNVGQTVGAQAISGNMYISTCIVLGGVTYIPTGLGADNAQAGAASTATASIYMGNNWQGISATLTTPTSGLLQLLPLAANGLDPTGEPWTVANINAAEFGLAVVQETYNFSSTVYPTGVKFPSPRITSARLVVGGRTSTEERTHFKIFVSNTDWLLADETVSSLSDIDTEGDAPITDNGEAIWSVAHFNNRVWFTNGIDEIAYFPETAGSNETMADLAGDPICACLGTYASRLFAGDVVESAIRTKYRVLWSAINVGTDFTSATAGSLDLDETPGAVKALVNFTEARDQTFIGVLAVFKDDSIFHMEATGVPSDPFDKRVMNNKVGLLAPRSIQVYTRQDGTQVIAFLGVDNGAVNVYEWDGDVATPIGDPISDTLRSESGFNALKHSWAYVDPNTYYYVLGVPLGGTQATKAWAYDITRQIWASDSFEPLDSVGIWRIGGVPTAIAGKSDSLPYAFTLGKLADWNEADNENIPIYSNWRTGWKHLGEEPNRRATIYRVWIYYRNVVPGSTVDLTIHALSPDQPIRSGGATFDTEETDTGELFITKLDFTLEGTLHQVALSVPNVNEDIAIERVVLEYEENDTFV